MNTSAMYQTHGTATRDVSAPCAHGYRIVISPGLLDDWPAVLRHGTEVSASRCWLVTDSTVLARQGRRVLAAPGAQELVKGTFELAPGETSKSVESWLAIIDWLGAQGARRRDVVLALGGSVVSDVAGFAAASFMRGIRYVNLPTSVLAQVDGSVGGKVAVNTPWAKNIIGAFHHPAAVLIDPTALSTLPRVEIANGLAEVIKSFVISPGSDFARLSKCIPACLDGDIEVLRWVIRTAIDQKMDLVDPDPYEGDLDRVLNFGHTLGHAIEAHWKYRRIRHGMAVAIGIACATRLGLARGLTSASDADQILDALVRAELPHRLDAEEAAGVVAGLRVISAIRDGKLRFVIPCAIGRMKFCDDVTAEEVIKAAVG